MSPRRFSPGRRLALVTVLLASACLIGCAGATRMPVRSRGLPGAQGQASKLDNGFVESTSAQQEETADKLASIDTGYRDPHLFWGRWDESKAGYSRRAVSDARAEEPTYSQHMETPNTAGI
jgi:hypothetical protein